ncbi:DnaJ domain-containing protein [Rhodospirillum sp. A1_3_36]|uniref:DnaJ domain-containing protein n=1 Tax=Rhodospirillum sp. A1_3_36 TaxID=3391666 RepID=UPI0039A459E8
MAASPTDPKGYYRILGLSPDATEAAIKKAYRHKAMILHPDLNKSPNAVAEFQRLNDAHQTLADPKTRRAYDTLAATPPPRDPPPQRPRPGAQAYAHAQAQANRAQANRTQANRTQTNRTQTNKAQTNRTQTNRTQTGHAHATPPPGQKAALGPQPCAACGQVTAQPRFVILEKVTGLGLRVKREPITGVFCRRCAERYAFLASLHCWLKGWWAIPSGPFQTIAALWVNLRGGLKPPRENSQLLLRQARAFLARGDRALAQGLANQALALAPDPGQDRLNAERMLNAMGAEPERRLRNVWSGPGSGFWLQLTPPVGIALMIGLITLPWYRPSLISTQPVPTAAQTPSPPVPVGTSRPLNRASTPVAPVTLPQGRIHSVAAPTVALRTGPGTQYEAAALAKRGTFLVVLEVDADGIWARAMTAQGLVGFVPLELLRPIAAEETPPGPADGSAPEAGPGAGKRKIPSPLSKPPMPLSP